MKFLYLAVGGGRVKQEFFTLPLIKGSPTDTWSRDSSKSANSAAQNSFREVNKPSMFWISSGAVKHQNSNIKLLSWHYARVFRVFSLTMVVQTNNLEIWHVPPSSTAIVWKLLNNSCSIAQSISFKNMWSLATILSFQATLKSLELEHWVLLLNIRWTSSNTSRFSESSNNNIVKQILSKYTNKKCTSLQTLPKT